MGRTPGGSLFQETTFDAYYEDIKIAANNKKEQLLVEIESTKTPDGPTCKMNKLLVQYLTNICNQSNPNLSSILKLIEDLLIFHLLVFQRRMFWSNGKKHKWFQWVRNIIKKLPMELEER